MRISSSNSSRLYLLNATQTVSDPEAKTVILSNSTSSSTSEVESSFIPCIPTESFLAATTWQFKVEGSQGKTYNIFMDTMIANCSCPDCSFRHKVCKHIYFIVGRVAQYPELLEQMHHDDILQGLLTHELNQRLFQRIFNRTRKKEQNDDDDNNETLIKTEDMCPICFENEFITTNTLFCPCCNKAVHTSCMRMWWSHQKNTCPLCRGSFPSPQERRIVNDDECLVKLH